MNMPKSVYTNDIRTFYPRAFPLQKMVENIPDSSSEKTSTRNFDRMWDALTEALEQIDPHECKSMTVDLDPSPVDPCRMQVVDKIHLGSEWDHSDPHTDAIKWLFVVQDTCTTPKADIADPYKPLVLLSFGCDDFSGTSRSTQPTLWQPVNHFEGRSLPLLDGISTIIIYYSLLYIL
jgi:hypothetical protein